MLEWNNNGAVGQFGRFQIPPQYKGFSLWPSWRSAPGQQRFQAPNRVSPESLPPFFLVKVFVYNRLMAEGTVSSVNFMRAVRYLYPTAPGQLFVPGMRFDTNGGLSFSQLDVTQAQLPEVLRLLGLPIYFGINGFSWNSSSLGAPIQLIKGNRYQSRWLVAIPPTTVNQPQQTCSDVLVNVQKALFSMASQQGWPWQSLGAYGAFSQIPAGWPSDMRTFPFEHPGACLVFLDGVWGAPTTTVDSANLPTIPGARAMDFRNGTTGQKLVEEPKPSGSPCAPADLTFDIVNGIFKCAGQILPSIPAIPASPIPIIPAIPAPPVITPTTPPITITPTGEKKEEKSSVLPWVIGGGVVLLGGAYLLSR